jgi:uncharacterized protein (UPF0212 family)
MEALLFATIARGHCRCPKCGDKKSLVAKQEGGGLLEDQEGTQ